MSTALTWGEMALLLALFVALGGWAGAHAETLCARRELERQRRRVAAIVDQARERAKGWQ